MRPPILTYPPNPPPRTPTPPDGRRAAIAAIFRLDAATGQPQLLFIRRANNPRDPWSGNVALPGGKQDAIDGDDDEATAIREASEEVGLQLTAPSWHRLVRLTPDRIIHPGGRPMVVSLFGFAATTVTTEAPDGFLLRTDASEVSHAWWVPATWLSPERLEWRTMRIEQLRPKLGKHPVVLRGCHAVGLGTVRYAAIPLPPPSGADAGLFVLWGLTLLFLSDARRCSTVATPLVGAGAQGEFVHPFRAGGGGPLVDAAFRACAFGRAGTTTSRELRTLAIASGALLLGLAVARRCVSSFG